jgi:hypothetical protein
MVRIGRRCLNRRGRGGGEQLGGSVVDLQRGVGEAVLGGEQGPGEPTDLLTEYPVPQLTREDLKSMSPEDVVAASADGRMAKLLGQAPLPVEGQLAEHHLRAMSPEQIVQAEAQDRLDALPGRQAAP